MIRVVACGVGNVRAFVNVFTGLNIPVGIATGAADLQDATHVILPGVGSFDWAMSKLAASGMREVLDELALVKKRPLLAVCVGMQMLGTQSEEGTMSGLNWIEASVEKFDGSERDSLRLPHMGWNGVRVVRGTDLFRGLEQEARFYFLHSYRVVPRDDDTIIGTSEYGAAFASAIQRDNVFGVQFHPEKSHQWGIRLLQNFAGL